VWETGNENKLNGRRVKPRLCKRKRGFKPAKKKKKKKKKKKGKGKRVPGGENGQFGVQMKKEGTLTAPVKSFSPRRKAV